MPLATVLTVLLCSGGDVAAERERNMRFERISLEQGLSQGTINTILQDRDGFMWFGTEDGLNRFDGYEFEIHKRDSTEPGTLSHNFVWSLLEDRKGVLWVGTEGGGLGRWDSVTGSFRHFRHEPENPDSLSHDRVRVVVEDRNGKLWIGTDGGGLNLFDPEQGTWRHFTHDPANPDSISHDRIRSIHEARDGTLWVGTYGGGLDHLDPQTGIFEAFRHDPGDPTSLSDDKVYSVYEDRQGMVWAGTYGGGLNRYDPEWNRFTRFTHDAEAPDSLGAGRVRAIYEDHDGTLWVGTDTGLSEWNPSRGTFNTYANKPADPRSLSDNKVTAIFQDRGGVLWIGTKGDGISKWNPATASWSWGRKDPTAASSLSSDRVTSMQRDPRAEVVWIGTFGGGLNRLDRATGKYTHFRHDPADLHSLADDRVMSLLLDRDGILWVGTYTRGLDRFDPSTGQFTHFPHDPEDPTSIGSDGVTSILQDGRGRLWVGAFEGGLNRFDPRKGRFYRYLHDPGVPTSIGSDRVTTLAEDADGTIWIGTDGGGLNRFEAGSGTFARFRNDPDDPRSLSSDSIWSILEAVDGSLWVGTQNGGLNRWKAADRQRGRVDFIHFTERDGLPNNQVYGILSEDSGRLWLSTNKGLARFDPDPGTFKTYDTTHGLQSNEFNFGAYHKAHDGEMFFGGIKGFNSFYPTEIDDNPHAPAVVLTSFMKFNKEVALEKELTRTREIVLDYTDDVVSFEFAALDYAALGTNRYAYKLKGFNDDWIELGPNRRATFTNLDAGDYTLHVKAANNDGVWNEDGFTIAVQVLSPPWQTWWAYSLYGLGVVGMILAYTRAQRNKLRREEQQSRRLEKQVEERTRELNERNAQLVEANKALGSASVTDPLTGLRNRRYLMEEIEKSISFTERYYRGKESDAYDRSPAEADFLFVMIDLDGLKGINDTYGHMAGDRAILQMRDILCEVCRKSDTVIRWGGDEFLIVGRNMSLLSSEGLAERLRAAVADHNFEIGGGKQVQLSCSIGFAQYPFVPSAPTLVGWEQVVTIADRALYIAKQSGRNAWVAIFGNDDTPPRGLVQLVNDEAEQLARTGAIEIRSSIPDPDQLVWSRAS